MDIYPIVIIIVVAVVFVAFFFSPFQYTKYKYELINIIYRGLFLYWNKDKIKIGDIIIIETRLIYFCWCSFATLLHYIYAGQILKA